MNMRIIIVLALALFLASCRGYDIEAPDVQNAVEERGTEIDETQQSMAEFARCIGESGAVFYGTSWCPYCNMQKEMFGEYQSYIDYVECSGERANSISSECLNLGITAVPSWIYEGNTYRGMQSIARLSDITGCSLP
jgi:glutaredoxin